MNVLIDTSVWSLVLRRKSPDLNSRESAIASEISELVLEGRVRLIGVVRQETLSGIKSADQYERLRRELRFHQDEPLSIEDFEAGAKTSNEFRSRGVQSSLVDSLICATAVRRHWSIFTTDPDFNRYAQILSLRLHKPRNLAN